MILQLECHNGNDEDDCTDNGGSGGGNNLYGLLGMGLFYVHGAFHASPCVIVRRSPFTVTLVKPSTRGIYLVSFGGRH